ncbi:MAG: hypothetical protein ACJA02_000032 [Myxococcota bacterium]|jgi:hypothetical protein
MAYYFKYSRKLQIFLEENQAFVLRQSLLVDYYKDGVVSGWNWEFYYALPTSYLRAKERQSRKKY